MKHIYLFILFTLTPFWTSAQKSNDINQSIIAQAEFADDGILTLSWLPKVGAESYNIRFRNDLHGNWEVKSLNVTDTFFIIEDIQNEPVEFLIETAEGNYASSYILTGNDYFVPDEEEIMLIIVKDNIQDELSSLLEDYVNILNQELIRTKILRVDSTMEVMDVKAEILALHSGENIDYILILGHVPVPYSGNSAIDGHDNHSGAWVADGFYGEIDGNWTDSSVNNTSASREANHNIPNDGKFDQTVFVSDVEIALGRVDFSNLPKLNESELELTRRYLERNILYRTVHIKVAQRAIIDNNFNLAEGFAQGAVKSFHTFLEPDSISYGDFSQCTTDDYLFAYGAGGGNYQGANGIISTNNLVNDSIQAVFTTVFGSYFGDWDVQNNLLRAALARGSSLINAWSGRPIWYFHHMAMGKTVGQVLLNTQNNNGNYVSQFGKGMTHTSLLGDPSLKMFYEDPIENLDLIGNLLTWEMSLEDPRIVGFTIYAKENDEEWQLLGDEPIATSFFDLSSLDFFSQTQFLVRPVSLITSRSGSYYNEGNGRMLETVISNTVDHSIERRIFPNPSRDYINIDGAQDYTETRIFDVAGRLILKTFSQSRINISKLSPGLYYLQHDQEVYKFVKE